MESEVRIHALSQTLRYLPEEHLADEPVLVHRLLVLSLGHFGPHLKI